MGYEAPTQGDAPRIRASTAGLVPIRISISSSTPDADPNLICSSAAKEGKGIRFELQSPGAYPLPNQACYYSFPLKDALGKALASVTPFDACDVAVKTDGLLPDDAYVFAAITIGDPGSGHGYGGQIRGNAGTQNDGARLYSPGTGWSATAITGNADIVRAHGIVGVGSATQLRSHGGWLSEEDGTQVGTAITTILHGFSTGYTRLIVGAGWVAGGGGPTASVLAIPRVTLIPRSMLRTLE